MYIAVDIGGTNTRLVGSDSLETINFTSEPVRRRNSTDYEDDITFIVESAKQISGGKVDAIGIGLVGNLNDEKTHSLHSKNNAHWNGKGFALDIAQQLGCHVFADNDASAAALGEAYYGSVKTDFAYLIWGTGIGGALVSFGAEKPRVEMLDWDIYFNEWEYACSGKELANTYGKPTEEFNADEWREVLAKFEGYTKQFIDTVHPTNIVFGGGLSVHHKGELATMSERLKVTCSATGFDGDSGLYGGFALIRNGLGA